MPRLQHTVLIDVAVAAHPAASRALAEPLHLTLELLVAWVVLLLVLSSSGLLHHRLEEPSLELFGGEMTGLLRRRFF